MYHISNCFWLTDVYNYLYLCCYSPKDIYLDASFFAWHFCLWCVCQHTMIHHGSSEARYRLLPGKLCVEWPYSDWLHMTPLSYALRHSVIIRRTIKGYHIHKEYHIENCYKLSSCTRVVIRAAVVWCGLNRKYWDTLSWGPSYIFWCRSKPVYYHQQVLDTVLENEICRELYRMKSSVIVLHKEICHLGSVHWSNRSFMEISLWAWYVIFCYTRRE